MAEPQKTHKPANVIAALIFILCTGIFSYTGTQNWLPFLILNLGIATTLRQMMLRHHFDTLICIIVFGGAFISSLLGFFSVVFLPSLFILGAIYFIIRQFFSFKSVKAIPEVTVQEERPEEEQTDRVEVDIKKPKKNTYE